ncbi:MAG: HAD-IG family 5'-nucleotidase [Bdellovibrionales bacterium]|nr:HAD-IG family 5'-nucleotidase [Bdellovibrionales bacterium]
MNSRTPAAPWELPLNRRIFVSRTLNLNAIRAVGFDMDYTLVLYDENKLENLAFEGAVDFLVRERGYPETLRELKFSSDRVVRGLVADKSLGNLVKINRFGYVKAALHGDHFYSRDDVRRIYANQIVTFLDPRYEMAHTLFSLSTCSLYCQLVKLYEGKASFEELYRHVDEAIGHAHRQGFLKSRIMARPQDFVLLDPDYATTLRMLRSFGKRLVLVTNSEWEFTQAMMSYSYDRYLPKGQTWRDLFELVVVSAAKPQFFTERPRFYEVIPESGHLKNLRGALSAGSIYQGGNAAEVESFLGLNRGQILYVGDHVYSDVLLSKKSSKWRTMLVITELESELAAAGRAQPVLAKVRELMVQKEELELRLSYHRRVQADPSFRGHEGPPQEMDESSLKSEISKLDTQLAPLIREYESQFHPYWGELLWSGNDKSHLSMVIERYACTHTSKVSNLLGYSPAHYFRPPTKSYL